MSVKWRSDSNAYVAYVGPFFVHVWGRYRTWNYSINNRGPEGTCHSLTEAKRLCESELLSELKQAIEELEG